MPFHKVDGAHVVVKTKGVYRQLDVYEFNHEYYAKRGGGFVPLYRNGTNFADDVLVEFSAPSNRQLWLGKLDRLRIAPWPGGTRLKDGVINNAS